MLDLNILIERKDQNEIAPNRVMRYMELVQTEPLRKIHIIIIIIKIWNLQEILLIIYLCKLIKMLSSWLGGNIAGVH